MNTRKKEYFKWLEGMKLIVTLFPYMLMDQMNSWDGTKLLVFLAPPKPTVDLNTTYNSDFFSVDTNDEKYQNDQLITIEDEKYE